MPDGGGGENVSVIPRPLKFSLRTGGGSERGGGKCKIGYQVCTSVLRRKPKGQIDPRVEQRAVNGGGTSS